MRNGQNIVLAVYLISPSIYSAFIAEDHQMQSLCKCVTTIAENYFHWSRQIVVSLPSACQQNAQLEDCITRNVNWMNLGPCLIISDNGTRPHVEFEGVLKASVYILLANTNETRESFGLRLLQLKAHPSWNSRAKVVVTVSGRVDSNITKDIPRDILAELWKDWAIDAIVLIEAAPVHATYVTRINDSRHVTPSETGTLEVHAWFPYEGNRCGGPVLETCVLDYWSGNKFIHGNNLFVSKLPRDLHGCPVVTSLVIWEPFVYPYNGTSEKVQATVGVYNFTVEHRPYTKGIDISILREIATRMNFQPVFRPPAKGQWVEVYNDLEERLSETAVGLLLGTVERYEKLDHTLAFFWEIFPCWVPAPKPVPRWMSIKRVLSPTLWMWVILAQIISCIAFWLLSLSRESGIYKSLTTVPFTTISVILSVSVPKHPQFWSLRMFFILFAIYSLLISTAFQTGLVSILAEPGYLPSIKNIDELLASGLQYGMLPGANRHFMHSDDPRYKKLLRDFVDCSDMDACLDRVAFRGDFGVFTAETHVKYLRNIRYVKNGKHLITTMKEYVNKNEVSLFLTKGSLLLEGFDLCISRMLQGGLIRKIRSDYLRSTAKVANRASGEDKAQVLTMVHFEAPFTVWAVSLFCSAITFLCEVTWKRYLGQLVLQNPLRGKAISWYGSVRRWLRCKQLEFPAQEETGA